MKTLVSILKDQLNQDSYPDTKSSEFVLQLWESCNADQRFLIDNLILKIFGCSLDFTVKQVAPSLYKKVTNRQKKQSYYKSRSINILWEVEDILKIRPDLSDDQAIDVLLELKHNHCDCLGINTGVIESTCHRMYPELN